MPDNQPAPGGIQQQQGCYDEEHIGNADLRRNMPAQNGPTEHADELRRLIEAINAPKADGRRKLTNQIIGGGHEPGNRDAMDKA